MEIIKFTPVERDVYGIYCGNGDYKTNSGYFVYSHFYGLVAYTLSMSREDDEKMINRKVCIKLAVIDWCGTWSLHDLIKRGITKMERQYVEDKKVEIEFVEVKTDVNLGRLGISAEISHLPEGGH